MANDTAGLEAVRALLTDSFDRVRTAVESLTSDLTPELATYRPDDDANTVAWLLWHLARVQDDHVSELAGLEQVWTSRGWAGQFGLPFDPAATGYGHDREEVERWSSRPRCSTATRRTSTGRLSTTSSRCRSPTSTRSSTARGTRL